MSDQPTLFEQKRRRRTELAGDTRNAAHAAINWEEKTPIHPSKQADPLGLGKRQRAVYDVIRHVDGISNSEIAHVLGWTINRVTPRVFELRRDGHVGPGEKRECTVTGSRVQTWRAI